MSLRLLRYLWFGGESGTVLPGLGSKVARHSNANSAGIKTERLSHREVAKTKFEALSDINRWLNACSGR